MRWTEARSNLGAAATVSMEDEVDRGWDRPWGSGNSGVWKTRWTEAGSSLGAAATVNMEDKVSPHLPQEVEVL
jgi:hypothetical protein